MNRTAWINDHALPHVFLLPGALHCAAEPAVVTTVLGSCVAVCLWDRRQRMGGINHFVLPGSGGDVPDLRYGDYAIGHLVDGMKTLRCRIEDLEAKVFGGAAVLSVGSSDHVGTLNVSIALSILGVLAIPVVARRTGGKSGLVIRLNTGEGGVLVRRLAAGPATEAARVTSHRSGIR